MPGPARFRTATRRPERTPQAKCSARPGWIAPRECEEENAHEVAVREIVIVARSACSTRPSSGSLQIRGAAGHRDSRALELDLRHHLDLARCRDGGTDRSGRGCAQIEIGESEIRLIEDVETFPADLQSDALGQWNILVDGKVHGLQVWPAQDVVTRIAENILSRYAE